MTPNDRTEPGVCRPLEKRYRCPSCWQRFYFKPNLDYHMQRKHGTSQQPGVCPECKGLTAKKPGQRYYCDACNGTGQQTAQSDQRVCFCDSRGIGEPGVTCGDCPRDYKRQPAQPDSGKVVKASIDAEAEIEASLFYSGHVAQRAFIKGYVRAATLYERSLRSDLTAAQQRIAALHAALRTYGWHKPECDYMQEELPCTCGFLTAVERDFPQEQGNG